MEGPRRDVMHLVIAATAHPGPGLAGVGLTLGIILLLLGSFASYAAYRPDSAAATYAFRRWDLDPSKSVSQRMQRASLSAAKVLAPLTAVAGIVITAVAAAHS